MIVAGRHQVGDIGVSGRRDHYPFVPTVMHTENEFGAASLEGHPDSARTKMMMWLPSWAEAAFMPRLGDTVIGEATINSRSFTYFTGNVDAIKAGRRKGDRNPNVFRFGQPTVSVRDYDRTTGGSVVRSADGWLRENGTTTIAVAPRDDDSAENDYGRREVTIRWSLGAGARPNHVLVLGGPTNASPLDLSATSASATVPSSVSAPVVSVTGVTSAVRANQTVYRVTPGSAVSVSYTFTVNPRINERRIRMADPVIVDVSGSKKIRGRFIQIDASDFLAPAGRMRIGDKPFPMEYPSARWNNVRNLLRANDMPIKVSNRHLPGGALVAGTSTINWTGGATGVSAYVRPLDIDSRSALEVLQRTAMAAGGAVVTSTQNGLDYQLRATPFKTLSAPGTGNVILTNNPDVCVMPSSVVEEVPRTLSTTSIVNQVEWDIAQPNGDGGVDEKVGLVFVSESISKSGPSPIKLTSDAYREGNQMVTLQYRAVNLLRTEPVWTFDDAVEITDIKAVSNLAQALDPNTRHGHAVLITGDRPADVGEQWRVRAGSFMVGEDAPVKLQLDPAGWLPDLGASYQDVWIMRSSPRVTFANMGTITFDDMMEVDY